MLGPVLVLGEPAGHGNGSCQKPIVGFCKLSHLLISLQKIASCGFCFYFLEAELSVFFNGLLCFCAEEGQGLNLNAFIIDSMRCKH